MDNATWSTLLQLHFGFNQLRPGQEQAIQQALSGGDCLVIMPTGGGKSLCFQLPALLLPGVTLVVSPLIALMKDQVDRLNTIGIPATFINSSISLTEADNRLQQALAGAYRLIYIAPERFHSQSFQKIIRQLTVSLVAVDEAHCISQWGHDFRPSYLQLRQFIKSLGRPPILALTATATPEVRQDIAKQLDMTKPQEIITGFGRPNLHFGIISTADGYKKDVVLETIQKAPEASGIVYVSTRQRADELVNFLTDYHISAVEYHAGLTADERQRLQNEFMTGRAKVIVATNAFGMGIDKADLRFVIHYDMPGTIEAYYQEAGRAGRDGQASLCLLLHSPRDRYLQEFFIEGDNPSVDLILDIYDFLTTYPDNHILITYGSIKSALGLDVPDLAVGTALKVLEKEGYLAKTYEKTSQATLKLASPNINLTAGQEALGSRAKKSLEIWGKLYDNYSRKLRAGYAVNLEFLASDLRCSKDSLTRLLKKLQEKEIIIYEPPFKGTEITLLKRCPRQDVQLDRQALRDKLLFARNKLDKMEDYVYHHGCRQKYILNYFGEKTAEDCGHCDWCRHRTVNQRPMAKQSRQSPIAKKRPSTNNIRLETKLTQLTTLELHESGLEISQIATSRNLQPDTIVEHFCYLLEKNLLKDTSRLIDDNALSIISDLLKQRPQLINGRLGAIKEELPSYIDWPELKMALAFLKNQLTKK